MRFLPGCGLLLVSTLAFAQLPEHGPCSAPKPERREYTPVEELDALPPGTPRRGWDKGGWGKVRWGRGPSDVRKALGSSVDGLYWREYGDRFLSRCAAEMCAIAVPVGELNGMLSEPLAGHRVRVLPTFAYGRLFRLELELVDPDKRDKKESFRALLLPMIEKYGEPTEIDGTRATWSAGNTSILMHAWGSNLVIRYRHQPTDDAIERSLKEACRDRIKSIADRL